MCACVCEEPEIMLFTCYRHVTDMVISDEIDLIIWVDDKICLVMGKQALWGNGGCLLWRMCGRDAA